VGVGTSGLAAGDGGLANWRPSAGSRVWTIWGFPRVSTCQVGRIGRERRGRAKKSMHDKERLT
jgi:hypothetical protein